MLKLTNRSCTPWRICHTIFFVYTKPDKKTRFTPNLRHFRTICRGAAPDTVGTVSTETDFLIKMSFFYHFIQNMKWVSSFILNSKFNSEAYFLHSSPFASVWCKGRKTMTFDCHILHEHFSCGCCNYNDLKDKLNMQIECFIYVFVVFRCVSLSGEAVR